MTSCHGALYLVLATLRVRSMLSLRPRSMLSSWPRSMLSIVLTDNRFTWLVTVILVTYHMLLFHLARISVSCKLPLIDRKRSACLCSSAIPYIPSASLLRPIMAPVLTPVGWPVRRPSAKVPGRLPVIAHWNTQDGQRHNIWVN